MRKSTLSMLLLGEIAMNTMLRAQGASSASRAAALRPGHLDVAIVYDALQAGTVSANSFWMQG